MEDRVKKIIQNYQMIDAIRVRQNADSNIEHLKNALGISRTTADKIIAVLTSEDNVPPLVQRIGRSTIVNAGYAYFLGISIGTLNIRVSLLGLDFVPVTTADLLKCPEIKSLVDDENTCFNEKESDDFGLAFSTPNIDPYSMNTSIERIRSRISKLVSHFLNLSENGLSSGLSTYPLAGIGFAVAGPVDYEKKQWISAPHMTSLQKITIQDLVGYENVKSINRLGIFTSIDNNAKCAILSEYFNLLVKNDGNFHDDLALVYIGSGIGSAAVIDGKLLRGRKNCSGELGQMQIYIPTDSDLLQDDTQCREIRSNNLTRLEEHIKEDCRIWLPKALCSIICILGVKNVILAGHTVRGTDDLIPSLMDERTKFTVASTQMYCNLEQGRGTPNTAAIGAAIEAYYTMCNFNESDPSNRTNLAFDISL